ncbi:glycosyltransferase family 2 protein [uncultured Clostridium sp.]|uniref:tetratricopeptide repeat-containing glycosyltransferase family 2 protein n=1 Tax=uncultured Clostridium sp. TaxID=59620 RepID=UPI0026379C11|nr:glycosyltransferase family 2 protein [uncultured Clostridium sp.]
MNKTISACIIAKNEEKSLERCLESLENIVDEIILVDTGSADKTVEIAKRFGVKVYFEKWEDDFSKARNKALDYATKEYILYIDCDEYLVGKEWRNLKKQLDDRYEGYNIVLTNIIDKKETLENQSFRIFKNKSHYRFNGKIHEQILECILKENTESEIGSMPLQIYHLGYDGNECNIVEKQKRNFRIYEKYDENEKDGFFYYNLASEYLRARDNKNAIKYYILAMNTEGTNNGYRQHLSIYLTKTLIDEKRFKDAIMISTLFLDEYPNFRDLHFLRGNAFYSAGKYTKALKDIEYYYSNNKTLNYPNFRLDSLINSKKLLSELTTKSIEFNKQLLSIVINYEEALKIESNIPKVNEFCENIILFSQNDKILKEGEQYFCIGCKTEEEVLENIKGGMYTFYFKDSEFMEFSWFVKTIELINKNNDDLIKSIALDEEENIYETIRVAKTEIVLKETLLLFEEKYNSKYKTSRENIIVLND